ncbi:MAG: acyl-[acyl-carrier-protein] thioesterase [Wujia sp.]
MYKYNKKILFSDIDSSARMSVSGIMNAMQDCVNINSESVGRGISYMKETKRAWFAISWNIEIKRYPGMFEDVVVKTWPYDFSTSMGFRNVIITDSTGQDIVCADSIWTLVDMTTGRPVRITEEDRKGYDPEERYPMPDYGRKVKIPDNLIDVGTVQVCHADIDFNGHMSNARYIQMAAEYVDRGMEITRIRVEYKNQSRYGEHLKIMCAREPWGQDDADAMETDGSNASERYVVSFTGVEDGSIKASVEFLVR